jgi:hypothetical protein
LRELLPQVEIFGLFSKANKMGRILANSGLIKHFFYFPENPNEDLKKFIVQLTSLLCTSVENDDAPDSLSGMCAYLEKYKSLFKEDN